MAKIPEIPQRIFDHTKGVTKIDCNLHCPAPELEEIDPNYVYKGFFQSGPYCKLAPREYEAAPRKGIKRYIPSLNGLRRCVHWDNIFKGKEE